MMGGWKVALGAFSLGIVIGWLLWTFVYGQKTLTFKVFSGLVTVAVGSASMAAFRIGSDNPSDDFMFYFVGMAACITVLGALGYDPDARSNLASRQR
jgi:hypothetical protein